uniref:Uncharacterized protein n=1 Tax=Nelumbo nucifera TaxID=4432 RepID=A0A822XW27_NELNU|nr:TPA_asm: hypothetical protein HUJ06_024669 [Nelumbo nucifera]
MNNLKDLHLHLLSLNLRRKKENHQWCEHCKKSYHATETCWDIHGKPPYWKPRNQRKGNPSAHVAESAETKKPNTTTFTLEQMEILRSLLHQQQIFEASGSTPTAAIAQRGSVEGINLLGYACLALTTYLKLCLRWIADLYERFMDAINQLGDHRSQDNF